VVLTSKVSRPSLLQLICPHLVGETKPAAFRSDRE
jgi:hypothetical protein